MIDQLDLDDDPEIAFAQWVKHFDEQYLQAVADDYQENNNYEISMNYMVNVLAAASALDLTMLDNWEIPEAGEHYASFNKFRLAVQFYRKRAEIGSAKGSSKYSVGLTVEQKSSIYDYIDKIRAVIEQAGLTEDKLSQLLSLLVNFRKEVEQKRTNFGRITDTIRRIAGLTADVEEAAGRPVFKYIKAIYGIFDEAKEEENVKISNEENRRTLPSPPKRLEAPKAEKAPDLGSTKNNLDDDIPF